MTSMLGLGAVICLFKSKLKTKRVFFNTTKSNPGVCFSHIMPPVQHIDCITIVAAEDHPTNVAQ